MNLCFVFYRKMKSRISLFLVSSKRDERIQIRNLKRYIEEWTFTWWDNQRIPFQRIYLFHLRIINSAICISPFLYSYLWFSEWTNTPYCFLEGFLIACPAERAHSTLSRLAARLSSRNKNRSKRLYFRSMALSDVRWSSLVKVGAANLKWIARDVL